MANTYYARVTVQGTTTPNLFKSKLAPRSKPKS